MSEKSKEESQSFPEFLSLTKKIEDIITKTPDTSEKDVPKEEIIEQEVIESEEVKAEIEEERDDELDSVEKQTEDLDQQIDVVKKETQEIAKSKQANLLGNIEKNIKQIFSETDVSITDFYYSKTKVDEDNIIKKIKGRLHSLEDIKIHKHETLGFPFALCKIENEFRAIIPMDLEGIYIPAFYSGKKKQLKLISVGKKEFPDMETKEKEGIVNAINKIQLNLLQLLNRDSKEKLSKIELEKTKIIDFNPETIQDFIKEYEEKLSKPNSYQNEFITFVKDLKKIVEQKKNLWTEEDFQDVIDEIKPQLQQQQEKQKSLSRDSQVSFIKLKRTQKQLDARTKRLKIDEKRGKKVTREQKEELIAQLREFQKQKKKIHDSIQDTKEFDKHLERWIEIFSSEDVTKANEKMLYHFGKSLLKVINEVLENQEVGIILNERTKVQSSMKDITVHVIYMPINIITFKAKQANQGIEGKILYFAPADEITFLKPSIN